MRDERKRSLSPGLTTLLVVAGAAVLLTCACGLGALFVLREVDSLPPIVAMWIPTATASPSPVMATSTALPVLATPTQRPTRPPTATVTPSTTPTPTLTATRRPSPTPTTTRTPLPRATSTPTIEPSPTPFVCEGMEDLATMRLAPGQPFECTIQEETFTDLANNYEESPCSWTRITLDDGEIRVQCQMGLTMSATLAAQAKDCRLVLQVLGGTFGFTGVVQGLIDNQFNAIRYDEVCVETVDIDNGEAYIAGSGR